jgi:hypothetical protein
MPSLMVYTEETFYYQEDIHVIARQDYLNPNETCLTFFKEGDFWFSFEIADSIYSMQGIRALIIFKMKERGHTPDFMYSRKRIEYDCSEKQILDTVDFYITESSQSGVLSVMEQINHSKHLKAWNVKMQFYDFTGIRQFTDSIFYSMFVQQG